MGIEEANGGVEFKSARTADKTPSAAFTVDYRPISEPYQAQPGNLDHWLTERYCLYTIDDHVCLCRGEIHHAPWPLQEARAEIRKNTPADALEIPLADRKSLLHYSEKIDSLIRPLEKVEPAEMD